MKLLVARKKIDKKYCKIDNLQEEVYNIPVDLENNSIPFNPNTKLEKDEWYYIENISLKGYFLDIMDREFSSATLDQLIEIKNTDIDVIAEISDKFVVFQKVTASKVIYSKKFCYFLKNECGIRKEADSIEIAVIPSALYNKIEDRLYFRKFSDITTIFEGIIELYREATDAEVVNFLNLNFVETVNFSADDVKTENRKRISMVQQEMGEWNESERQAIIRYIRDYATDIDYDNGKFVIHDEKELRSLLWGLEQRFYTTIVGGKKYIANSVRSIE